MLNPGLYVVATPIGRLRDITLKAIEVLKAVDVILCEDTRTTQKLLKEYQISKQCLALHKFNEATLATTMLEKIQQGQSLALVSDAGTPAIHDPGARIVQAAQQQQIAVFAIPGPSSVTAALSVAGCIADQFLFHGFISGKSQSLITEMQAINNIENTVVCFESPHRIKQTLETIHAEIEGERELVICKELTKMHEAAICSKCSDIPELLQKPASFFKGEWVLVFKPFKLKKSQLSAQAVTIMQHLLPVCGVSQAVKITKEITGESKKYLYEYAIQTRSEQ